MNDRELMKTLVAKAKSYSARHVPAVSLADRAGREAAAQIIDDWAAVLKLYRFPPKLWGEAVQKWAMNPEKEFLDPGVLQSYAYKVRDEWEAVPEKRAILETRRNAYLRHRVAKGELPPANNPNGRQTALQAGNAASSEQSRQQLKQIIAELREKRLENASDLQRAKARAKKEKQQARFEEEARKRELAQQLQNERKNL